jgi:hypothetical protein
MARILLYICHVCKSNMVQDSTGGVVVFRCVNPQCKWYGADYGEWIENDTLQASDPLKA